MTTKKIAALLLPCGLVLGLACAREGAEVDSSDPSDTAVQATETELPGTDQPGDLNPVEAQIAVDDVTIGKQVGADGVIPAESQGDDFAPGETVHVTMNVGDTPAGSQVKVVWYGPNETKIGEETKSVEAGRAQLAFQSTDTGSWQKGDYRAEVWIGDEKVNQQQFQVVDASESGR
ncbi:MAG TPA: hypothetical protein VEG34_15235 [Thermoanaerobaculia bacterium]|nr:hypothetical protein [Thermoanaerobaculia bacterium]